MTRRRATLLCVAAAPWLVAAGPAEKFDVHVVAPHVVDGVVMGPFHHYCKLAQAEPLIDPVRHRVEPGETAYSIARLYGVSVTALAS